MNSILQLKGQFQQRKNENHFGPVNLPKNTVVSSEHIIILAKQLQSIEKFWKNENTIGGVLVSAHYKRVVPKSSRLQFLLGYKKITPNNAIVGAKFVDGISTEKTKTLKHVITYFISFEAIEKAINALLYCEQKLSELFNGEITDKDTEHINKGIYNKEIKSKIDFLRTVVDANSIESFRVDQVREPIADKSIITVYKTGISTIDFMNGLGIEMNASKMIDETTMRLDPGEIAILQNNAPYLIAMSVSDFSKIEPDEAELSNNDEMYSIESPKNEPIVGVIDTQFDERVYFHEWVNYKNELTKDITLEPDDYLHGTAITSIVVDGPKFNPNLEDGCGHFRVCHFGVALAKGFSSFSVLKKIRDIVANNRDIKVWNLSLGSEMEIDENFMSPEAAELDRIQTEYDVIFIVAGTNNKTRKKANMRIGAPADSLNSLVVNSVDFEGKPASYTRIGPVLSFFYKPDICYYGGDIQQKIKVCEPLGEAYVSGTSIAAPWITRKVAYLIYIVGLSREVAKALIIDSAAGWNRKDDTKYKMGYGIVPKKIGDIIHSRDDEIRFVMSGTIDEYETYTYNIPIPQDKGAHPFFAKATLTYFPTADRNQGVDYTSTEMDLHFGRIVEKNGKACIKAIDYNKQAEDGLQLIFEEDARRLYRKWDNVKHISEALNENARARKAYPSGNWGLSIKTKERVAPKAGRGLRFGVVVTLREMNGINRIDEFIKLCMVRGWLVNRIDIQNQLDVYNKAEEDITFE